MRHHFYFQKAKALISVVFSDIYMSKMEEDAVKPLKPIFYKRYVQDTYVKRKRNESDTLYDALNSYHPNIKFTLEQNPKRFLDIQIIKENNQIKTQVFVKKNYVSSSLVLESAISLQEECN